MTDHQRIQIPALSVRDRLGIRPETITRDATDAPVTPAAPDAINPPPDPSAAVTEPHSTEGETR